jgi:hypothetical protein
MFSFGYFLGVWGLNADVSEPSIGSIFLGRWRKNYIGLGMCREWKEIEFPKEYFIWIWEQQDWEVDQEIDSKMRWERMEE